MEVAGRVAKSMMAVVLLLALATGGHLALAQESPPLPLGKEISAAFHELIAERQAEIQEFILRRMMTVTTARERRLNLIKERNEWLKQALAEIRERRLNLIKAFRSGEITLEAFVAEMRALAAEMKAIGETMGSLGKELAKINREMAGDLREQAQSLAERLRELAQAFASEGRAIGEEMGKRGRRCPVDFQKIASEAEKAAEEGIAGPPAKPPATCPPAKPSEHPGGHEHKPSRGEKGPPG